MEYGEYLSAPFLHSGITGKNGAESKRGGRARKREWIM